MNNESIGLVSPFSKMFGIQYKNIGYHSVENLIFQTGIITISSEF